MGFDLLRALRPLATRLANVVGRGVVESVDDSQEIQEIQIEALDGEIRDEVERFQNYGFTSRPREGAEFAFISVGGRREHTLAIAVDDRRYRVRNLESGEVAVYNDTGAKVVFKANGDIEVTPKPGQKLKIASDVEVTGTLTASVDVVGGGKSLKTHTHSVSGSNGSGPVVFIPVDGRTGGPS